MKPNLRNTNCCARCQFFTHMEAPVTRGYCSYGSMGYEGIVSPWQVCNFFRVSESER